MENEKRTIKYWLPHLTVLLLCIVLIIVKSGDIAPFSLLLKVVVLVFGGIAAISDLRLMEVSNKLILAMIGAWICLTVPQLFLNTDTAIKTALNGLIGFLIAGTVTMLTYIVSKKGLGGGSGLAYRYSRGLQVVLHWEASRWR